MTSLSLRSLCVVAAIAGNATIIAEGQAQQDPGLGSVHFPVSCSAEAQAEFNRGIALLHHMTYPRAREACQKVAQIDEQYAMAHWGLAMTLFQPLWPARPALPERTLGWEAAGNAMRLATTERERTLVQSVAAFFREPESPDYWQRIRRWERAMASAHTAFPNDAEIAAFYALAHLASAPANDDSVAAHAARAANLLLDVYRQNPAHPRAMHYLVHANEAPGRERSSLDAECQ